jgi:hypothetical protein
MNAVLARAAAMLLAVLLTSCGSRPSVTVSIAGVTVPMTLSSTTDSLPWVSAHGDADTRNVPVTTLRAPTPLVLQIDAGQGASEIRGWIYDVDAPSSSGGPIEEFTLPGGSGAHQSRSMIPGRTYSVLVNVRWSFLIQRGEVTHVFRVRAERP